MRRPPAPLRPLAQPRTVLALAVALAAALAACGDKRPPAADGSTRAVGQKTDACATPNDGCPCTTPGATTSCGEVRAVSQGGYVSCSMGTRTCSPEGKWGACQGDHVTTMSMKGLHTTALGTQQACSPENPCDPYCQLAHDDATDLDAGAAFTTGDAGLALMAHLSGDACTSLTLTPSSSTIRVTGIDPVSGVVTNAPASVRIVPTLLPAGCAGPSPKLTWSIDDLDRAVVDATGLLRNLSAVAGKLTVTGYFGGLSASASVDVVVAAAQASTSPNRPAPPGQADKYGDPVRAATDVSWEYPYERTVFPLGLPAPLVQYVAAKNPGNSVKIRLRYPAATGADFDWSSVVGEGPGLAQEIAIPQPVWQAFERTAKGGVARISLQRWAAGKLQAETTRDVSFASGQLSGQIFYTEYERAGISPAPRPNPGGACGTFGTKAARTMRLDPSKATGAPIDAIGGGGCPVCHTVSSKGRTMVTANRSWGAKGGVLRVNADGTTTPLSDSPQYPGTSADDDHRGLAWAAVTPDGDYALEGSFFWGNVRWDGSTRSSAGAKPYVVWKLPTSPGGAAVREPTNWGLGGAFMLVPSFAPDGSKIVFVDGDSAGGASWRRGISTFDADLSAHAFSNRSLAFSTAPSGDVLKWPTFEPDSRSVVFVRSPSTDMCTPGACDGRTGHGYGNEAPSNYFQGEGSLWSVDASKGQASAAALANATKGERPDDDKKAFQPTVLPESVGGYRWVVFTSSRPYGHLVNPEGTDPTCAAGQLWVAAVDDRASDGTDRSHPAFWLPNQSFSTDITTNNFTNERAHWVLAQCKAPGKTDASLCQSDADCCAGSRCQIDVPASSPPVRHCQPTPTTCGGTGDACTTSADCCAPGVCANAQCTTAATYEPATFTRDYVGSCPTGTHLVWRFFQWQATTPDGTSISFRAQTADAPSGLASAASVDVGRASGPQASGWTSGPKTVDEALVAAGDRSRTYLRVTMDFAPSGASTPALREWRQLFDCIDAE